MHYRFRIGLTLVVALAAVVTVFGVVRPDDARAGVLWGGTNDSSFVEFQCDTRFGGPVIRVTSFQTGYSVSSNVTFRWWEYNAATGRWSGPVGPYAIGNSFRFTPARGLSLYFFVEYQRPGFSPFVEYGLVKQDGAWEAQQGWCRT